MTDWRRQLDPGRWSLVRGRGRGWSLWDKHLSENISRYCVSFNGLCGSGTCLKTSRFIVSQCIGPFIVSPFYWSLWDKHLSENTSLYLLSVLLPQRSCNKVQVCTSEAQQTSVDYMQNVTHLPYSITSKKRKTTIRFYSARKCHCFPWIRPKHTSQYSQPGLLLVCNVCTKLSENKFLRKCSFQW